VGITGSTNFPLVNPVQAVYGGADLDGFVARFFPSGSSVAYSTFLGGNLNDQARAIDLRGNTDAYVAGSTGSPNFPLASPYQAVLAGYNDIFISRITDSTPPHEHSQSITYSYDPLYRLTAADYDDGTYFHYIPHFAQDRLHDPVGNRLTETTIAGTTTYVYDDANPVLLRSRGERPPDERRRRALHVVGQREPALRRHVHLRLRPREPRLAALAGRTAA